jgi:transcriptional regulator with PAS, ATPase and Fis domain
VKGAFTGAFRDKIGRFELAHNGTIFLDEIENLSPNLQIKLLRVLQDREIERVGDANTFKVDVRVIAASNRNLKELMLQDKFREDLYYRLNVVPIFLPPLRERKEDIPLLVDHFIEKFKQEAKRKIYGISREVLGILLDHPWRGNVRELENVIAYSFVKCKGRYIQPYHLPPEILQSEAVSNIQGIQDIPKKKQGFSLEVITSALKEAGWNKSKAARKLGIHRTTLWHKMKEYQLQEH